MHQTEESTLSRGVAGKYHIEIKQVLKEAWNKTYGIKLHYWILIALMIIVSLVSDGISSFLTHHFPTARSALVLDILVSIVSFGLTMLVIAPALLLTAIRHISDQDVSLNFLKLYKKKGRALLNILGAVILTYVIFFLGTFVFIGLIELLRGKAGILLILIRSSLFLGYLIFIAYVFTAMQMLYLLILDKNLSAWQATLSAFRGISHEFAKIIGLYLLMFLLMLVATAAFFIGLIWVFPMLYNMVGILYREIYGVEIKAIDEFI